MTLRTLTLAGECEVRFQSGRLAVANKIFAKKTFAKKIALLLSCMLSTLSKQGGLRETRNARDNCHRFLAGLKTSDTKLLIFGKILTTLTGLVGCFFAPG